MKRELEAIEKRESTRRHKKDGLQNRWEDEAKRCQKNVNTKYLCQGKNSCHVKGEERGGECKKGVEPLKGGGGTI